MSQFEKPEKGLREEPKDSIMVVGGETFRVTKTVADAYNETLQAATKPVRKPNSLATNITFGVALTVLLAPPVIWAYRWALGAL